MTTKNATPAEPATPEPAKPKGGYSTDNVLRLAAKLDRMIEQMPHWGRVWAIRYLNAKYLEWPAEDRTDDRRE